MTKESLEEAEVRKNMGLKKTK